MKLLEMRFGFTPNQDIQTLDKVIDEFLRNTITRISNDCKGTTKEQKEH